MKRFLGGGGLGDAVLLYSQLMKTGLDKNEFHLTHGIVHNTLISVIAEFYESQNINFEIIKIGNWGWYQQNAHKYDKLLNAIDTKNNEPFPIFNIGAEYDYDIVISPSSGRNNERNFSHISIVKFINDYRERNIVLLGVKNNSKKYDNLGALNLINKTKISESIDIIASSKFVIAPSGFVSIVGNMLNKNVFTQEDRMDIREKYYRCEWKNKFINDINDVII